MIRLVGANPGLTLFDTDGRRTAFCSVWQVDWSERGTGTAVVLWHEQRVRVYTATPGLGHWLSTDFTRWFPEVDGLPWPDPEIVDAAVEVDIDAAGSCRARAVGAEADVELEVVIEDPLDRRRAGTDTFALDGVAHTLSTVFIPCRTAHLTLDGRAVDGRPQVSEGERPSSSAFVAVAEVWSTP